MSWLTISCSGRESEKPGGSDKPTLTDKEKCEKIIDAHADCFEKITNNKNKTDEGVEALKKCAQESLKSMEQNIQSEKMKNALKEVLTAFGIGPAPVPSVCVEKSKNRDDQFICMLRLEKQKACSQ